MTQSAHPELPYYIVPRMIFDTFSPELPRRTVARGQTRIHNCALCGGRRTILHLFLRGCHASCYSRMFFRVLRAMVPGERNAESTDSVVYIGPMGGSDGECGAPDDVDLMVTKV